jgi:ABC-type polysaccharide/polyol phosphate export permease
MSESVAELEGTHAGQAAGQPAADSARLGPAIEQVIRPARRRVRLRQLPGEASVIRVLAARDFKVKYKQSLLGPLWLAIQPLLLLAGFLVAFRGIADVNTSGVPYVTFALVGLAVWTFFQAGMTIGSASVITNTAYVRFTPCPRPAFPIAALIASLPSCAVTLAGAIVAAAVTGDLSPRAVLLPFGVAWLLLLTAGAAFTTSALAVRYRDMISALPFLLQIGIFMAPIGYSLAELSQTVRVIVELNPLTGLMEAWRWMTLSGYETSAEPVIASALGTILLAVVGWFVFTRLETTMADEI